MQYIHIISVGKLNKELVTIANKYQKMIKNTNTIKITQINYVQKLPKNQIKQFETKKICQYLSSKSYKIVLDVEGKNLNSFEFTNLITISKSIDFIIGGVYGLDETILGIADTKLSLSKMTFPYQIAKIVLLEQIYRALTILNNHPYHK